MSEGEFSVYQFFDDGTQEKVRDHVGPKEAAEAAHHYCTSVAAQMGITKRVIITDGGDCTNFEWKFGEGITFPPRHEGEELER
jgi:hypothetical protein